MYKKDLDALIFNKKVPNFILLRGQDDFQNELYAKRLIEYWQSENFMSLYFSEFDFEVAKSFFEPSLFGGENTLYIKTNSQIKKDELKVLISMCQKDSANRLIYELNEEEKSAAKDFTSAFGSNDVRFFKPNNTNEAINLLVQKCQMCGVFPNTAALEKIYSLHNENLNLSANEIEKFANLQVELNLDNVKNLVTGLSEVSYDELFDEVFSLKHNNDNFKAKFFALTQNGIYNEIELINNFYRNIYRIFKIHSYIKNYGAPDFKKIFGYAPPINLQNKMSALALAFDTHGFFEIFKNLNLIEFELKTKKSIEKTEFLLASLLKFQRILADMQKNKSKY